jgi:propionyl-CoA carboxylase alpha chain
VSGPIRRLLVANRGEIARRIARTARASGVDVVAVYAPSDAAAPFVHEADVAVALRGTTAAETYLDIDQIVAAALATGADAVHPGYGFLSERAAFATAVLDAGLTWVGPPPAAIEAMGDKLAAKALMAAAGVPVLPSLRVDRSVTAMTPEEVDSAVPGSGGAAGIDGLADRARAAGFRAPLLVKAAAGGGGRGMRIVRDLDDLGDAVRSAAREAESAFGDGTVFVETYVPDARHVEIQVLADDHGHVVHCFERDCSIQRRHQKIIEEAPSPALDVAQRDRMGAAAVDAARAIGYRSAGTVEFVLDGDGAFWFLEVNTRLQVEHPVTEAVTGLDLVREQLRIAAGLALSVTQEDLHLDGHAIEARLYAEDPAAGFLPATGTLVDWSPAADPPVRWDSGVEVGSVVGVEWDPMLAKVVAHAPTREEAAGRLALALARSRMRGVTTNRDFLVAALRHPQFIAGRATTAFVERDDVPTARPVTDDELITAAVAATLAGQARRRAAAGVLRTHPSGWRTGILPPAAATWDLVAPADTTARAAAGPDVTGTDATGPHAGRSARVTYGARRDGAWDVTVAPAGGTPGTAAGDGLQDVRLVARVHGDPLPSGTAHGTGEDIAFDLEIDGRRRVAHVLGIGDTWWVQTADGDLELHERPRFAEPEVEVVAGGLVAPMPGRVIEVSVTAGESVTAGALLVVVEAMKMEHRVTAPHAGVVRDVRVATGDQVGGGDLLVVVDVESEDNP